MTIDELRALARWHARQADDYAAAAKDPTRPSLAQSLELKAAWHRRQAHKLNELADAFATFGCALTPAT